jgi:hypothetical protein
MVAIVGRLIAAAAGALVGAAVAKELEKPSDQRGWHGEVAGIPYDFRRPTSDKLRRSAWDPDNPKLFTPHAFGVGWSVNLARVAEWIQPPGQAPATTEAPAKPELTAPAPKPELPPAVGTDDPATPLTPATTAAPEPATAAAATVAAAAAPEVVPASPAATAAPEVVLVPEALAPPEGGPEAVATPVASEVAAPEPSVVVVAPEVVPLVEAPLAPEPTAEPEAAESPGSAVPADSVEEPSEPHKPAHAADDPQP